MAEKILLTGGTGFLGTELAARLVRLPDVMTYVLVRAEDKEEAVHRLKAAWFHDKDLYGSIGSRVLPIPGDFTVPGVGLKDEDAAFISENITLVIHSGAEIGFNKSGEDLENTNYTGTKNMVFLAKKIKDLRRFVHVSTAYVAGQKSGLVMEEEPVGTKFSSLYEMSKADAECLVRDSGLPFSVCRPGMIIGDSKTGWIKSFNTVYYIMKLVLLGKIKFLPIEPETPLNMVPVDYVADSVLKVCMSDEALGRTFHLTCPADEAPGSEELNKYVRDWAEKNLGTKIAKPVFMPLKSLKKAGLEHNKNKKEKVKGFASNMLTLLPYFYAEQRFDRTNTDEICGPYDLDWRDYIDKMLEFACRKNFMRQTGDTVFEQAKTRRGSKRYPINYYDVTDKEILKVTGPEANKRIEKAVDALWALGVRKGDRVALTGINSVDYMVLEQAIGLTGAVSVPIYYTTPAEEASMLLKRSGSKWFFIGDERMMGQIDSIETEAEIIAFSVVKDKDHPKVMTWDSFIAKATGHAPKQYPDPEDLATIRYTSGTTGDPKGVMFNYYQLAWMGEVLTNLLTWKDRNDSMRYLSFLPLSHVVEGILASYAPYYTLCKVDYFYLNDFGSLTKALPKVRPNVFFSVPRFYEKVWDQVTSNPLGKAWLAQKDGPAKKALGKALRAATLRKAGLDHCGQLIVGSAPISETLLMNFRSLGIEIYNAYGQTEAPLITINRLGDNIIPTIGTPLPDTEVTAEEDGELIVKGPQVTLGYYGLETDSIKDGVLRTGDLGTIHENGHITLFGRKKDFVVTAYGKNISIPKIEEKIKDIPGVSEAVLIGERRPYCTALIWLEGEVSDLDKRIEEMNAGLSHPEQIRQYRVIERPLKISEGELTPNLKVKRGNVEAHFSKEIEEMYR